MPAKQPSRTTVFLTGGSGNWGRATLRELRGRDVDVIALVLPTERDRAAIAEFHDMVNLEVVFGDLTDYEAVEACVRRADFVLHVGAVVSPLADAQPELARRVNIGSMRNIIRAVQSQPDPARIGVIGIGSVAETGDRSAPYHWGRVGDPIRVSQFDEYGQTKVIAERMLVDSGLPKWAWLRQTGIFHPGLLAGDSDPIVFHTPLAGVLEWVSVEDSARLLANICEPEVPAEFWGGIYNIGGGEGWRISNWEFQERLFRAMGVNDPRGWYQRNWFATQNFHGQWYTDSERLEELVPFRRDAFDEAAARAVASLPDSAKKAGKVPAWIIRNFVMKRLSRKPRGTMHAIRSGNTDEINAHFGSLKKWKAIGDWSTFVAPQLSQEPALLDHGYDEEKDAAEWSGSDYAGVAAFRGGRLLTEQPTVGDIATPLDWECAAGHRFTGSPRLILTGGHWCPECVKDSAAYREQAVQNDFLAQLERPVGVPASA